MGRRGQECRCCGCPACKSKLTLVRANIAYPSGSGVTLSADPDNDPPEWQDVTTDCSVEQARRFVRRVRITNPGEGYTEAPTLAITGGGGTPSLDAYIEITSGVVGIDVDDGGSGFATPPAVTFVGGGAIKTATAQAVIAGKVTSVTLTNGGEGYSAPPTITFAGGQGATATAVMDGYVASIAVVDGGEGYTSAPTVTLSGGGGTAAAAQASISTKTGQVTAVSITNKGEGYTSAPTVQFSGGGGTEAKATASLLYSVASVTVDAGGDGYPFQPTVTFQGAATQSAQATAAIEGSVIAVEVANPGRYRNRRNAAGTVLIDWPTISISGATATPRFSGSVTAIDPGNVEINELRYISVEPGAIPLSDNKNYSSIPDVTVLGGGGQDAAAVAELNWLASHERTVDVDSCLAFLSSEACYFAESEAFPSPPQSACVTSSERFEWGVAGLFTLEPGSFFVGSLFGQPSNNPLTNFSWLFNGEGGIVIVSRGWNAGFVDTSYDCIGGSEEASEVQASYFVARKFSRVPPDVTYQISFPIQPAEATNASITPEWTQYVDAKGDSFWYLESLAVTSGGDNLFFPPDSELRIAADGNAVHEFQVVEFEVSRQAPAAEIGQVPGFQSQPSATITLSEFGSPAQTFYRISGAQVTASGETDLEDGPVQVPVVLTKGHWAGAPLTLTGTISDNQLTSIELPIASQQILAPATLTSVSPQEDENFNNGARFTTGRSPFQVTYSHTQPTISAKAVSENPEGTDAVFNVVLAERTDLNGDPFWEIESAIASEPGSGQGLGSAVVLEVASPGIEAVAPLLVPVPAREPPALVVGASAGGFGPFFIEGLQAQLAQQAGEFGDPYWEITGVTVPGGTILPSDLFNNNQGTFLFFYGGTPCRAADVTYTTDNDGFLTAVQVNDGGNYFVETDGLRRLHVLNSGRFFIREFNVSSDPLPDVSCIGPVSEAAGWDRNTVLFQSTSIPVQVDEQYGLRVRRCPLPEIDVEIE